MDGEPGIPLYSPNGPLIGYTFARHIGLILDELSSQGLDLWRDENQRWRWRWLGTELQTTRGFWALGEALIDAVVVRYPALFATEEEGGDAP